MAITIQGQVVEASIGATVATRLKVWVHDGDEDWFATYWDRSTGKPVEVCYFTTRFASSNSEARIDADDETRAAYAAHVRREAAVNAAAEDYQRVMSPQPDDLRVGLRVSLIRDAKTQARSSSTCPRCAGEGAWINPRNASDRRVCFACSGSGTVKGDKLKTPEGKPAWNRLKAGTVGEVVSWASFGTFYRKGYNKPCASNTTVQVRLEGGEVVPVSLAALRLAREARTMEAILADAETRAA